MRKSRVPKMIDEKRIRVLCVGGPFSGHTVDVPRTAGHYHAPYPDGYDAHWEEWRPGYGIVGDAYYSRMRIYCRGAIFTIFLYRPVGWWSHEDAVLTEALIEHYGTTLDRDYDFEGDTLWQP